MPPPDRWEKYSAIGTVIPGTRIVCFKVPLKQALCKELQPDEQFTPQNLVQLVSNLNHQLGLVIDLTFTTKYYNYQEIVRQGIRYEKIFTEGHNVPKDEVVYRFFDLLEKFYEDNIDDKIVVGVHCTHGVNRTGYIVCRYMIERLAFDPEEAIKAFGEARGHPLERENYLEDLKTRSHNPDYAYAGRETLPMTKPVQTPGNCNHGASRQDKFRKERTETSRENDDSKYKQNWREDRGSHGYRDSSNSQHGHYSGRSQDFRREHHNSDLSHHPHHSYHSNRNSDGGHQGYRTHYHDDRYGNDRNHAYHGDNYRGHSGGYHSNYRGYNRGGFSHRQHDDRQMWGGNHYEPHRNYNYHDGQDFRNDMYRGRPRGHRYISGGMYHGQTHGHGNSSHYQAPADFRNGEGFYGQRYDYRNRHQSNDQFLNS